MLVDSRHGLKDVDRDVMKMLDDAAVSYHLVLTKGDKIKPTAYGDDFSFSSGFYQDPDNKIYQHYRFEMRVGNVVSVVYLFGREEFFQDQKDRTWTGQGDWFTSTVFHRM